MADPNQYLRLKLGDANFLLPGVPGFVIEPREHLAVDQSSAGNATAWRTVQGRRVPAYCLDAALRVSRHPHWQRAVFLDAAPQAVGLAVDEVELLPRAETVIVPFIPPGSPPTRVGPLFSGAWLTGNRVVLVFDPPALVAYLQSLGDAR